VPLTAASSTTAFGAQLTVTGPSPADWPNPRVVCLLLRCLCCLGADTRCMQSQASVFTAMIASKAGLLKGGTFEFIAGFVVSHSECCCPGVFPCEQLELHQACRQKPRGPGVSVCAEVDLQRVSAGGRRAGRPTLCDDSRRCCLCQGRQGRDTAGPNGLPCAQSALLAAVTA
jgi:hypothetical protein